MPVRKASEMDSSSDCEVIEELCRSSKKAKTSPSVKKDRSRSAEKKANIPKASPSVKKEANGSAEKKNAKAKKAEKDSMSDITNTNLSPGKDQTGALFIGSSIKKDEAARRWPGRYNKKKSRMQPKEESVEISINSSKKTKTTATMKSSVASTEEEDDENGPAECAAHYSKAQVDGMIFELGNCVHVNSGSGHDYIGQIVEFFEDVKHDLWFTAQWFFRVQDTAIKDVEINKHDKKRVFCSEVKDFNPLDCLVSKVKIVRLSPLHHFNVLNPKPIPPCDYYYDMGYDYAYSRFYAIPADSGEGASSESDITNCYDASLEQGSSSQSESRAENEVSSGGQTQYTLLDLYSGCGGMSTGLCMGANLSNVKLLTKWALDLNPYACKSLEYNHPETQVRNESAEDFLILLKEWKKLCNKYCPSDDNKARGWKSSSEAASDSESSDDEADNSKPKPGEYEVEKIIGIRHVGATESGKAGIEMKIRWKGYGSDDDTWEPISGLTTCEERIKKFVIEGKRKKILPMPGDVDVVCGGPPCQGASGFNRFRNREDPLADARNKQIIVYMDIVDYLKPRFVLMENVVDIVRFADGLLGRYALHRLVQMHYQAMLGMMVAGCYGLPQFRMRVFLWGAAPNERLPPYPLPTHDVVQKGGIPQEWERNMVAYEANSRPSLLKALTLGDALKDLPPVKNSETRDEMSYGGGARTEFQRFIRLPKDVLTGVSSLSSCKKQKLMLHDHLPLMLNQDDYQRVCRIPKKKGANFRSLPGVIVKEDNTVALDPDVERVFLPSGKPLVPDYAITFVKGRSPKPFGRLWWDETVPTVVTRAEPHNQAILHPEQDRVLTIRENARLQGFPDYYKLFGPVKQRYIQVGNAVAVPVGRALGYSLGLAIRQGASLPPSTPVIILPPKFPQGLMANSQQITSIPLEFEENEDSAA